MGGRPKALLSVKGMALLEHHLNWLHEADPLIVVTGTHHLEIATWLHSDAQSAAGALAGRSHARAVLNPRHELGQFSSLQAGLAVLAAEKNDGAGGVDPGQGLSPVVVLPVDVPPLEGFALDELVEATRFPGIRAAVPQFRGRDGHPVVLASAIVHEILARPPSDILRDVLSADDDAIARLPTSEATVLMDLDTAQDVLSLKLDHE